MSKRGPKIGDAVSLWNFAPSPGFTKEEVVILKYCLMYYGVGRWVQILESGYLSGKLIQQLNGQTQRLIGQQSLAAYTGLCVDLDKIREDNDKKDGERKGGLLINSGPNPTKTLRAKWQAEAKAKYGLSEEVRQSYKDALDQFKLEKDKSLIEEHLSLEDPIETKSLDKKALVGVLKKLRVNLKALHGVWEKNKGKEVTGEAGDGVSSGLKGEGVGGKSDGAAAPTRIKGEGKENTTPVSRGGKGKGKGRKSIEVGVSRGENKMSKKAGGKTKRHDKSVHPGESADPEVLQQILAMGFTKKYAMDALKETNFVLEDAVNWLMLNCA
ncbi:UBA domain-containing protein [Chloropicon primus]|uniref:UBA domain-containing protein n=1 Tax=Chloropicon primus TaxID=1764295 RepID=A0A5B8MR93_9CHLO|nr:hypothetical protein A3770_06p42800 [Chloropicon primus]UPR00984.1 UBA domain-containing protein [Chloropicon primus]|mmetsp:Transcript_5966/g.17917  ORF Transcript_5966/g.17917 Transcript_5966/m.17917 type:complete len:326 (-) Transcript_5966:86-1063(-)|eukprot:QDZ21762.1 hypothetical protein A3770_06p42800 [Chloropicon primus]